MADVVELPRDPPGPTGVQSSGDSESLEKWSLAGRSAQVGVGRQVRAREKSRFPEPRIFRSGFEA